MDKSFLQEEADQGGLVVGVTQVSQALQDAGDAQVVVGVTVNDKQRKGGQKGSYWKRSLHFSEQYDYNSELTCRGC